MRKLLGHSARVVMLARRVKSSGLCGPTAPLPCFPDVLHRLLALYACPPQVFPFYGTSSFNLLDMVPSGRGLPSAQVKDLAWQLLQALAYLHDKQVRRRDCPTVLLTIYPTPAKM